MHFYCYINVATGCLHLSDSFIQLYFALAYLYPLQFQPVYLQSMVASVMCPDDYYFYYYYDEDNWTECTTQYYSLIRLLFWVMGFLGK